MYTGLRLPDSRAHRAVLVFFFLCEVFQGEPVKHSTCERDSFSSAYLNTFLQSGMAVIGS
jgi:hypothetical protein